MRFCTAGAWTLIQQRSPRLRRHQRHRKPPAPQPLVRRRQTQTWTTTKRRCKLPWLCHLELTSRRKVLWRVVPCPVLHRGLGATQCAALLWKRALCVIAPFSWADLPAVDSVVGAGGGSAIGGAAPPGWEDPDHANAGAALHVAPWVQRVLADNTEYVAQVQARTSLHHLLALATAHAVAAVEPEVPSPVPAVAVGSAGAGTSGAPPAATQEAAATEAVALAACSLLVEAGLGDA